MVRSGGSTGGERERSPVESQIPFDHSQTVTRSLTRTGSLAASPTTPSVATLTPILTPHLTPHLPGGNAPGHQLASSTRVGHSKAHPWCEREKRGDAAQLRRDTSQVGVYHDCHGQGGRGTETCQALQIDRGIGHALVNIETFPVKLQTASHRKAGVM